MVPEVATLKQPIGHQCIGVVMIGMVMSRFEHRTWFAWSKSWTCGEESSSSSRDWGPDESHSEPLIVHCAAELGVTIGSRFRCKTGSTPGWVFKCWWIGSTALLGHASACVHASACYRWLNIRWSFEPRFILILRSRMRQIQFCNWSLIRQLDVFKF